MFEAIIYNADELKIINQLKLPSEIEYLDIKNTEDAWFAVKNMMVRGAPAIAIVSLLALGQELKEGLSNGTFNKKEDVLEMVEKKCVYLCSARKTAVNVQKECNKLIDLVRSLIANETTVAEAIKKAIIHIEKVLHDDVETNIKIGDFGAKFILENYKPENCLMLTHCNTGSLATAGYGTALGVIHSLHKLGNLERAYCTETRPYNQGARLTTFELLQESIPGTLICDDMVAALMNQKKITAIVVGADRVAANGDTANKIGTYQIAVLAKHHDVPFFVASPLSTIDWNTSSGENIPIEERPWNEMRFVGDVQIAPLDIDCWNPAFDVTPSSLITGGIITEVGVFKANELNKIPDKN